ncbi:hypothetical protein RvY_00323 [Ramazzottius varieornatus]|uniref:Uncharacterized protein n=1 Tax=Ramazzottius varieornatus TaxID=947166 RepID=A0A1D1UCE1_RAMVA|nr:hypothetical protein RvY_00323 [Ramazzottius varieornatus]
MHPVLYFISRLSIRPPEQTGSSITVPLCLSSFRLLGPNSTQPQTHPHRYPSRHFGQLFRLIPFSLPTNALTQPKLPFTLFPSWMTSTSQTCPAQPCNLGRRGSNPTVSYFLLSACRDAMTAAAFAANK